MGTREQFSLAGQGIALKSHGKKCWDRGLSPHCGSPDYQAKKMVFLVL